MNDEVKFSLGGFSFTWDDAKAIANIRKHHVSFEIAAEVLLDKYAVDMYDDFHSEYEERYKIIGRIMDKETILSVIYVERVNRGNVELIRIISAREATRKEKELYGMELPERLSARQRRSNRTYEDNQRRGY